MHKTIPTLFAVLLLVLSAACSSSTAVDTMPTNSDSARQLAQTVASNGGCDSNSFEDYNFNRAKDTWVFTCQKTEMTFEIIAYGSQDARSAGLKALDDRGQTYFAKFFYAVVSLGPGRPDKQLVGSDKQSLDSALTPFRNKS